MSSTISPGIISSSTASATALATAVWAGPKILLASPKFWTVTLGIISVAGFVGKSGLTTDNKGVCPTDILPILVANAVPTGPFLSPIIKSIWASSGPLPIKASPISYIS